ncbi:hypothetical protein TrST_g2861 [Triparma strigata]|uniref:CSN8/PSMD8/EIF3K domain-containing protein n=1 Tax=Triparma strigata TaxID=1606541 RepID=A0A9W6ZQ73_9STRA|nr:hypothetical protein TrST_g2861 [Triparma strigata]
MSISEASALLKKLSSEVSSSSASASTTLASLKLILVDFDSLPPLCLPTPDSKEEQRIACEALELGCLLAVKNGDGEAFEGNTNQLFPIYSSCLSVPQSANRKKVQGLYLMFLLVENRLADFHSVLQTYTAEEIGDGRINFAVLLERELMVGSYDKFATSSTSLPDPLYQFFMTSLLSTVRDNVADALEVSYESMDLADAQRMLMFQPNETSAFESFVKQSREDWMVVDNEIKFQPVVASNRAEDIPSMKLISQSLSFATEIERIV